MSESVPPYLRFTRANLSSRDSIEFNRSGSLSICPAASRAAAARSAMRRLTSSASSRWTLSRESIAASSAKALTASPSRSAADSSPSDRAERAVSPASRTRSAWRSLSRSRSSSSSSFSSGAASAISRTWYSSISSLAPRSRREACSVSSASRASLQFRAASTVACRSFSDRVKASSSSSGASASTNSRSEFCPWIVTSLSPIFDNVRTEAGTSSMKTRPLPSGENSRRSSTVSPSGSPASERTRLTAASGSNSPLIESRSAPFRTSSTDPRPPVSSDSASTRMDFPAPVSPVMTVSPGSSSISRSSTIARFLTASRRNIAGIISGRPGSSLTGTGRRESGAGGTGLLLADGLGGNAGGDDAGGDMFRSDSHGPDHRVGFDGDAGEDHGMVRDAHAVADDGPAERDVVDILNGMGVGVDVGVVGDRNVVAEDDFAPVVDQHVPVNRHTVADGEVVAEGELHLVEDADVLAAVLEDPLREHRPHLRAQAHVASDRGVVEHLPEPEERFDGRPFLQVDLPVVLRLHGRVAGIEGREQRLHPDGQAPVREGALVEGAAEIEMRERVPDHEVAVEGRVVQAIGQLFDEAGIDFFPDRTDRELAEWHLNANLTKRFLPVKLRNAAGAAFLVGALSAAAALRGQDPAEPPQGQPSGKSLPPPAGAIPRKSVDEKALRATVEELAACGTRHSLSSWEDPKRGIGCGRDRIVARLTEIARESGGSLSVTVDSFEATAPRTREKPVRLENVLAFLPGSDPKLAKTVFLVSGHFDSMPSSVMDPEADAPGADDDASGTAVSIECARLLSKGSYRATLLFAAVSGEEQGLLGGKRLLVYLKEKGYQIGGFLNNDIVGADFAPGGPHRVRVFSGGA